MKFSASRWFSSFVLGVAVFVGLGIAYSGGPPAGRTGAPGESTCRACHDDFQLNSGSASFTISAPAAVSANGTVPLTVQFANSATPRHGFQITARGGNGAAGGTWSLVNAMQTQQNGANHVNHTSNGINQLSWPVNWNQTATLSAGPITFYAAGNEADNSGDEEGDRIYTTSRTVYRAEISSPSTTWPMGGIYNLNLSAPGHAGEAHVVVMSESALPTPLGGPLVLPVNALGILVQLGWDFPSLFPNFIGQIGTNGTSTAQVILPVVPNISGLNLHFAFVSVNQQTLQPTEVSNRLTVVIQ